MLGTKSDLRPVVSGRRAEAGIGGVILLTARELSDYLGIHRETVYELTHKGAIPGHKVGGVWRYDPAEVLAALEV